MKSTLLTTKSRHKHNATAIEVAPSPRPPVVASSQLEVVPLELEVATRFDAHSVNSPFNSSGADVDDIECVFCLDDRPRAKSVS
jgi:hypothetical protein